MSLCRSSLAWLACLWFAGAAGAEVTADPLRLVPAQADLVLSVNRPGRIVEAVTTLEAFKQVQQLEGLRELYDSTNFRRLYQLLSYFEKELGVDRSEMLDRLAGDGVAAALKFAPDPAPVMLVVQGKDEKLLRRFVELAVGVVEGELARQDNKARLEKSSYRGVDEMKLGDKLVVAVVGKAVLVGNSAQTVHAGIDLHLDGAANSLLQDARLLEGRKLLPAEPLAWLWLNFEKARAQPQFKVVLDTFTTEPAFSLVLGGLPDILQRTPCLAAGVFKEADGFSLRLRYPRGRDGMSKVAELVVPVAQDDAPPLLEPKNVAFSASQFLDLANAYVNRATLLNKQGQKGLQELEKKSAAFGVAKLDEILKQTGPHQRFVSTNQYSSTVYKRPPTQYVGAYAFVQETRDDGFAKSMDGILRAAGLFASFKFPIKRVEEKQGDVLLASYRFSEEAEVKEDKDSVRFNFSPCYAQVGKQFMVASTVELGRELIDLLHKEAGRTEKRGGGLRVNYHFSALAASLKSNAEPLLAQAVLKQAQPVEAARREIAIAMRIIEGLGMARLETGYDRDVTRYDVRIVFGKIACCAE